MLLDEKEKAGLREFKRRYKLYSAPGVGKCIHRIKSGKRRHRADIAIGCTPPFFDHVFGFRSWKSLMPRMVLMPYYGSKKNLDEIVDASRAFAEKHGVKVRFSLSDTWWGPGTILIEYRRKRPLTASDKNGILRRHKKLEQSAKASKVL